MHIDKTFGNLGGGAASSNASAAASSATSVSSVAADSLQRFAAQIEAVPADARGLALAQQLSQDGEAIGGWFDGALLSQLVDSGAISVAQFDAVLDALAQAFNRGSVTPTQAQTYFHDDAGLALFMLDEAAHTPALRLFRRDFANEARLQVARAAQYGAVGSADAFAQALQDDANAVDDGAPARRDEA